MLKDKEYLTFHHNQGRPMMCAPPPECMVPPSEHMESGHNTWITEMLTMPGSSQVTRWHCHVTSRMEWKTRERLRHAPVCELLAVNTSNLQRGSGNVNMTTTILLCLKSMTVLFVFRIALCCGNFRNALLRSSSSSSSRFSSNFASSD